MMLLMTLAAATGTMATYRNARFGYSICYPDTLNARPESDDGDGRAFTGAGAELRVWGSNNALGQSVAAAARTDRARLAGEGGAVSYAVVRPGWYALSAREGATIVYTKAYLASGRFKAFELRYPASRQAIWGPLVTRIAACFRPGR